MGDPPAVAGQRLPHAATAQVPCQPAAVVADGRQRAPVGAERELLHPTVVPVRQPPALPRAEVQKRDAAVLAAEGGTAAVEGQPGGERPAREPPPHTERCRVHHVRRVLGGPGEDEAVTPCPDDGRGRVRPADTQDAPQAASRCARRSDGRGRGAALVPAAAKNVVTTTVRPPAANRTSVKPNPSPERGSENPMSRTVRPVAGSMSLTTSRPPPMPALAASSLPSGEKSRLTMGPSTWIGRPILRRDRGSKRKRVPLSPPVASIRPSGLSASA